MIHVRVLLALLLCFPALAVDRRALLISAARPVASAGGGSFSYDSQVYDGSSWIKHAGALTGISDGKQGTVSIWFRVTGGNGTTRLLFSASDANDLDPTVVLVQLNTENRVQVTLRNNAGTALLNTITASTGFTSATNWYHLFASWNLADGSHQLYIDGANDDNPQMTQVDDTLGYSTANSVAYFFGGTTGNNYVFTGKISLPWFATTYIASPSDFRNGTHPADLGTSGVVGGVTPLIYLRTPLDAHSNSGTGGDFVDGAGTITYDSDAP